MNEQLIHQIALTKLPGVGPITAKKLISCCGSPELVFKENKNSLEKVEGIGPVGANRIFKHTKEALEIAEHEVEFVLTNEIKTRVFFRLMTILFV